MKLWGRSTRPRFFKFSVFFSERKSKELNLVDPQLESVTSFFLFYEMRNNDDDSGDDEITYFNYHGIKMEGNSSKIHMQNLDKFGVHARDRSLFSAVSSLKWSSFCIVQKVTLNHCSER